MPGKRATTLPPEARAHLMSLLALNCDEFLLLPTINHTYNVNLTSKDLSNLKKKLKSVNNKAKTETSNNEEFFEVINLLRNEYGECYCSIKLYKMINF